MNLFKNDKYQSLIFNEKSTCTPASNKDAPFTFMDLEEGPFDQPSIMSSVKSLNNASPVNTKFFTAHGKIFLGPASPKTMKQGKVVKEDIT